MKTFVVLLFIVTFFSSMVMAGTTKGPEVTAKEIDINDKDLEKKLLKLVKEKGTLTSFRQGTSSYMIAILCEYPEDTKADSYCEFRKVKNPEQKD